MFTKDRGLRVGGISKCDGAGLAHGCGTGTEHESREVWWRVGGGQGYLAGPSPQFDFAECSGGEGLAVGAECECANLVGVSQFVQDARAGGQMIDEKPVCAGTRGELSVGSYRHGENALQMGREGLKGDFALYYFRNLSALLDPKFEKSELFGCQIFRLRLVVARRHGGVWVGMEGGGKEEAFCRLPGNE